MRIPVASFPTFVCFSKKNLLRILKHNCIISQLKEPFQIPYIPRTKIQIFNILRSSQTHANKLEPCTDNIELSYVISLDFLKIYQNCFASPSSENK